MITTLHVVELPSGRFGYVGRVPVALGYIDPTPEKITAGLRFGARFGPKVRTFETGKAALEFAEQKGYTVTNE